MTQTKKRDLSIRLDVPEYDHIDGIARLESRRKSDLVRIALDRYFVEQGHDPLPKKE